MMQGLLRVFFPQPQVDEPVQDRETEKNLGIYNSQVVGIPRSPDSMTQSLARIA